MIDAGGRRNITPESHLGEKSDVCLNPACQKDIKNIKSLKSYRNFYCCYRCYVAYPFLQAVVEKRYGKPLPDVLTELWEQEGMTEKIAAKILNVSSGLVGSWKRKYFTEAGTFKKRMTLEEFEMMHPDKPVRQVLVEALNSRRTKREVAKEIGISLTTLDKWIHLLGIEQVSYFE